MDTDPVVQLTSLLKDWDNLLAIVTNKLEKATLPSDIDHLTQVLNKLQSQRHEVAVALASVLKDMTKP